MERRERTCWYKCGDPQLTITDTIAPNESVPNIRAGRCSALNAYWGITHRILSFDVELILNSCLICRVELVNQPLDWKHSLQTLEFIFMEYKIKFLAVLMKDGVFHAFALCIYFMHSFLYYHVENACIPLGHRGWNLPYRTLGLLSLFLLFHAWNKERKKMHIHLFIP